MANNCLFTAEDIIYITIYVTQNRLVAINFVSKIKQIFPLYTINYSDTEYVHNGIDIVSDYGPLESNTNYKIIWR